MTQQQQQVKLPGVPPIGRAETFYARLAHDAKKRQDNYALDAAKVGQYITLALDGSLPWEEKVKYFQHALKRHCQPPPFPDEQVWGFYRQLAVLVMHWAGQEALRIASTEDDLYATRLGMGQEREKITEEAERFFNRVVGDGTERPEHFSDEDWHQLKMLRDQWV